MSPMNNIRRTFSEKNNIYTSVLYKT